MERRVVDIAEGRRHLSKRRGALVIEKGRNSGNPAELLVPFDEIESVIVHTPQATYSNAVLVELAQRLIPVVCCDQAHTPVAWLWPTQANFEQSRRMAAQASMSDRLRAALWQRIVRAKIEAQAALLGEEGYNVGPLPASVVLPDDRRNVEAQAARHYWKQLFDATFRRSSRGPAPNGLLNYGYAIVRASVARQVCAAGLHPSLGLHHHNRFNPFCLADDLMEPFRPIVDRLALQLWRDGADEVTAETKYAIAAVMAEGLQTDRGNAPLSRCVEWAAQSLAKSILDGVDRLRLPLSTGASA